MTMSTRNHGCSKHSCADIRLLESRIRSFLIKSFAIDNLVRNWHKGEPDSEIPSHIRRSKSYIADSIASNVPRSESA
jgi:hypothetical protein